MTKNEIIEKTLKEIGPRLKEHEDPYGEAPTCEEIIIDELQKRLPETDIKTCHDFQHLGVNCCDTCHTFYPHYEMSVIDLPDGAKAWVCDQVRWAIYPEQISRTPRVEPELPSKLLRQIFWRGRRQIDHSLFRRAAAGTGLKKEKGTGCKSASRFALLSWNHLSFR